MTDKASTKPAAKRTSTAKPKTKPATGESRSAKRKPKLEQPAGPRRTRDVDEDVEPIYAALVGELADAPELAAQLEVPAPPRFVDELARAVGLGVVDAAPPAPAVEEEDDLDRILAER